jgi:hypothetical protein
MVFGRTLKAPAYADPPSGTFEILGNRCVGRIDDPFNPPSRPIIVTAKIMNEIICVWVVTKQKKVIILILSSMI